MKDLIQKTVIYEDYMSDLESLLSELFKGTEWVRAIKEQGIHSVSIEKDQMFYKDDDIYSLKENGKKVDQYTVYYPECIKQYENLHILLSDYEDYSPVVVTLFTNLKKINK